MEIVNSKSNDDLKAYWEDIRKQWEKSKQVSKKAMSYTAYKVRLLDSITNVRRSLEIGFGDGKWLKLLSGEGIDAYGIDILKNAAIGLHKEGFSPIVADARFLPFRDNIFDLTYSFGVIEHFEGTEIALSEHVRVTAPGGKIIITVPYLYSPHTLYWIGVHIKRGTYKKRPATYGKRYTRMQVKRMLEQNEVTDIMVKPFLFPIPKARKYYHENPLLNRMGLMLWAEMTKL
jgi:SAM-dependent methyltransferase